MQAHTRTTVSIGFLALAMLARPASAAVKYEFVGRDYSPDFDTVPSFSFILPEFSGLSNTIIPGSSLTNCAVTDALLPTICSSVELRPNFFGQDAVFFYSANPFGPGIAAYNFDLGAFGAFGTYTSSIPQGNGPLVFATLTVSAAGNTVPEPATWAIMTIGLGCVGSAMRLRVRRTAANAMVPA